MVETLVIAVAFFCGTAPLRSLEHTSAQGLLTRLAVPASCPQPRAPLWLELSCGKESCAGRITQGTEAGHAHAALATIEGPLASLKLKFTPEEGPLLSKLRLSVTARFPLGASQCRRLPRPCTSGTSRSRPLC